MFCSSFLYWCSRANAPEICGVAIDVPDAVANPPGYVEVIDSPGAKSIGRLHLLENEEIEPDFETEPTAVTLEMHAGYEIPLEFPELPVAATTEIFFATALCIALAVSWSSESQ